MHIRNFTIIFHLLAFLSASSLQAQNRKTMKPPNGEKPNIIVILPDDLGWNDVGYHGSFIKTPNIDRLANEGVKFEQHYVMPTCTPSRVSLITGKYPSRYGVLAPAYGEVIDLGDPTLASLLQDQGYFTAISGKWHLGSPPYTPLKYGFNSSYGFFDGQIDPYTHEYKMETKLTSRRSWHRNDQYLDEEGHATDLITNEAIRIIQEQRDNPFFLYVAYSVPHYPLSEPNEWTSMYDQYDIYPSRKWYAASVSHMDDGIGQIIDALERTGQRENTLVVFISDNGGQQSWYSKTEYRGAYADKPHYVLGNNFPLRGWKVDLYEGGIRVPAFANWPGRINPNTVNTPLHIVDWLPTLVNLANKSEDLNKHKLDGKDIWPLLMDREPEYQAHPLYWKTSGAYAVRDGKWKLIVNRSTNHPELYDLETDFREANDLSQEKPEIVSSMTVLLNHFRSGDRER